jgi:hypothetical protein
MTMSSIHVLLRSDTFEKGLPGRPRKIQAFAFT